MGESQNGDLTQEILQEIKSKDLHCIASDFDQTFITVHTQGVWEGTAESLLPAVAPWAKDLMHAVLSDDEMFVTFSCQQSLIRNVLRKCFPDKRKQVEEMPICVTNSIQGHGSSGKLGHLKKAVEDIHKIYRVKLDKSNVLLLDDDASNINIAKQFGYYAILVTVDFTCQNLHTSVKAIRTRSPSSNKVSTTIPSNISSRRPGYVILYVF